MSLRSRTILQLDFDGTLVEGDASTGILQHFVGPEWPERLEAASRTLFTDPGSTALIDAMTVAYSQLGVEFDTYIAHVHKHHPPRAGLGLLIDTCARLGVEAHVVSNGFQFYIREHLGAAGVEDHVAVHCGSGQGSALSYAGPDGRTAGNRFKEAWTEHFLYQGAMVIYVGDGTSDIAAASKCAAVFARDSLLAGLREQRYDGRLQAFDTLLDVARGLSSLVAS
jgi:2-hydroxy-3-keto-5-methylthiopentenyl-1-phosphate phosphatase